MARNKKPTKTKKEKSGSKPRKEKAVSTVTPSSAAKIPGLGRLAENAAPKTSPSGPPGRIAAIGKFLLDAKDLEKIGKLAVSPGAETKLHILTKEAEAEVQSMLEQICTDETVVGSLIVGNDGLLIANRMPAGNDAEALGTWALGLCMNTEIVMQKMNQGEVHQIVCRTEKGYVVVANTSGGHIVTISNGKDTEALVPLMRAITQVFW